MSSLDIKKVKAMDGTPVEFVVKSDPPTGAMKFVYFSPQKDYVVAFYKDPQNPQQRARLDSIVGKYRQDILTQIGGDYWKQLFCWPERLVEWEGKLGLVEPTYASDFFFRHDPKRINVEKEGKWFASAKLLRLVDPQECGDFLNFLKISLKLSQALRRLHAAGLAHSDLSYKNVLIDPRGGKACIIDIDGLVVPRKYLPDVLGTPDFIAPEVITTKNLPQEKRVLPSQMTDRHALAVLIYMYLLHRHPLRGGRYFGADIDDEETLLMGTSPLFIEHPTDRQNRNMKREFGKDEYDKHLPWVDLDNFSAEKICGPFLWKLFQRAFIEGITEPIKRPIANDWESALAKTVDLLQPCSNPKCSQKYYVFDNTRRPRCPFCNTEHKGKLPILNFYVSSPGKNTFKPDRSRLMVWTGQSLFQWHVFRNVFPNEKLKAEEKSRVGYFQLHNGTWFLVNEKLPDLFEICSDGSQKQVRPGKILELADKKQILLSASENGRLAFVQMVGG